MKKASVHRGLTKDDVGLIVSQSKSSIRKFPKLLVVMENFKICTIAMSQDPSEKNIKAHGKATLALKKVMASISDGTFFFLSPCSPD